MKDITDLYLIWDSSSKQYVKGFAVIGGVPTTFVEKDEITKLISEYCKENDANKLSELPKGKQAQVVYSTSTDKVEIVEKRIKDIENKYLKSLKVSQSSPYDGATVSNFNQDNKGSIGKKVAIGAGAVLLTAGLIGAGVYGYSQLHKDAPVEAETEDVTITRDEDNKVVPTDWEEYAKTTYENDLQQKFFMAEMDNIESNVIEKTYNNEKVSIFLTPELATAMNVYYNTNNMEYTDMISVLGDYDVTNVGIKNQEALDIVRYSMLMNGIESTSDFITPALTDEVAQKLYDKYANLWVDYKTADTKKEKKNLVKEFENNFADDFLGDENIELDNHPSAGIILQVFGPALAAEGEKIDSDLYVKLFGDDQTDAKDSETANGLVDKTCAIFDGHLESFIATYELMHQDDLSISSFNDALFITADSQSEYDTNKKTSELAEITKCTYEVETHLNHEGVIIPMMENYLKLELKLADNYDFSEMRDISEKIAVEDIQESMLENSTGINAELGLNKVGDKATVTKKGVSVSPEKLTTEQKEAAIQANVEKTGVYDATTAEKEEAVKQEVIKETTASAQNVYDQVYDYITKGDKNGYDAAWATSTDPIIKAAYDKAVSDGQKNNEANKNAGTVSKPVDDGIEDTSKNPNQQNVPSSGNVVNTETITTTTTTTTGNSTTTSTPVDSGIQDTSKNPNQNGLGSSTTTTTTIESNVISGTETTDSTGAVDMSQFGEVQSYSLDVQELSTDSMEAISAYVEEMANPESEVNQEVEQDVSLIK